MRRSTGDKFRTYRSAIFMWGDLSRASLRNDRAGPVDSGIEAFFGLAGSGNFAV